MKNLSLLLTLFGAIILVTLSISLLKKNNELKNINKDNQVIIESLQKENSDLNKDNQDLNNKVNVLENANNQIDGATIEYLRTNHYVDVSVALGDIKEHYLLKFGVLEKQINYISISGTDAQLFVSENVEIKTTNIQVNEEYKMVLSKNNAYSPATFMSKLDSNIGKFNITLEGQTCSASDFDINGTYNCYGLATLEFDENNNVIGVTYTIDFFR